MKGLRTVTPAAAWQDYELIDSGGFEKLERFGDRVTIRPEPQAVWEKSLGEEAWREAATDVFRKTDRGGERGEWTSARGLPERWNVAYTRGAMNFSMRLGLTAFKHVGIFPEQADNWDFIFDRTVAARNAGIARPELLNLFAYTGGATLAGLSAGAAVTHVDSVRQVVGWAADNAAASGLDGARWIVDDALKFARREARRGRIYHGIIMDPPAYGRGPDGEKWTLDEGIGELLDVCSQLLAPRDSFLVLSLYSMGFSPLVARTAVNQRFGGTPPDEQFGELYFTDRAGKALPMGTYYRFYR